MLTDVITQRGRAALAQTVTRGREELVLIRPYENGLLLHSMYHVNEIRNFDEIARGEPAPISDADA
jgi:DNA end-binding protein Ku